MIGFQEISRRPEALLGTIRGILSALQAGRTWYSKISDQQMILSLRSKGRHITVSYSTRVVLAKMGWSVESTPGHSDAIESQFGISEAPLGTPEAKCGTFSNVFKANLHRLLHYVIPDLVYQHKKRQGGRLDDGICL